MLYWTRRKTANFLRYISCSQRDCVKVESDYDSCRRFRQARSQVLRLGGGKINFYGETFLFFMFKTNDFINCSD